jgi:hypothetical protein
MTYTSSTGMIRRRPYRRPRAGAMSGDDPIADLWALVQGGQEPLPSDNVTQTTGGGATTSASDFTSVGGVCKPMNFPALNAVRAFQQQLNRVAQVKGLSKTSVDGAIGPGTLALFRQVQSLAAGSVMGDGSTCLGVAPDVDVLGAQIKDLADTLGAPATVGEPIGITVPTIVTKSGKVVVAPTGGVAASLASMSGIEKIAILGVAGAIGYLVLGKKKRRKG